MEILSFKLNSKESFGISTEYILHLSQKVEMSSNVGFNNQFEGMFSFRGTIIPVLKMSSITKVEGGDAQIIIVLKDENTNNIFGLLAEKVNEVVVVEDNELFDVKKIFLGDANNYITHVTEGSDKKLISILNIPGLQQMFKINNKNIE